MNTTAVREKSLQDLYAEITTAKKEDFVSPRNKIAMYYENAEFKLDVGSQYDFEINDFARQQLNATIAPGFNTYARWLDEQGKTDVYLDNVNKVLVDDERKAQLRTIKDENDDNIVRAVLSDAYKTIDDDMVYDEVLPILGQYGDKFKALGGFKSDTRSYLKIISRDPAFSVTSGGRERAFHIGFIMKNSEVGRGFCEFTALLVDSFCENGCIFSSTTVANVKYAHRGTRIRSDFGRVIEDRYKRAELDSIKSVIADATIQACSTDNTEKFRNLIESSSNREVTGDISQVFDNIGKRVGLTKNETELAKVHFISDEPTQLGMQAAITALAQNVSSYDRRHELEIAGAKVLEMNNNTWEAINKLA